MSKEMQEMLVDTMRAVNVGMAVMIVMSLMLLAAL